MANIKYNICVITVTYSNRIKFLEQVINRVLLLPGVTDIVIADNASEVSIKDWKDENYGNHHIKVLQFEENMGSAFGYKSALEFAMNNTNADFFWFLDDDNVPEVGALEKLIFYWEKLKLQQSLSALYCFRPDRVIHKKILNGDNPHDYYLVKNNFMGFHVGKIFKNQWRKLTNRTTINKNEFVKMPYVPYGGFFISRVGVKNIGYPDERFFLYVDDSEYTHRVTKAGADIYLIRDAVVNDVDESQGINYRGRFYRSKILDLWSFRTYYHVRNRMYFYGREAVKNKFIFWVNKHLYLLFLSFVAILTHKQKVFKKFKKAVEQGLKGELNKADNKYF